MCITINQNNKHVSIFAFLLLIVFCCEQETRATEKAAANKPESLYERAYGYILHKDTGKQSLPADAKRHIAKSSITLLNLLDMAITSSNLR